MTKEDIIRMARDAGARQIQNKNCDVEYLMSADALERFAALVAAAERDAIIELAETPIGEYEIVVACGTEPETRHIPRYLIGQFLIEAIRARSNT